LRVRACPDRTVSMKRQRNFVDDSIYPVFITTTIVKWIPVFSDHILAEECLHLLERLRKALGCSFYAYVLMPHHLHAIVKSIRKGDISILMQKWKSQTARIIIDRYKIEQNPRLEFFRKNALEYKVKGQDYQVWMPRFDDFGIRNEKELFIKLNYIHGNPMKHHICEEAIDYPYSSFRDYNGGENSFIGIDCGQGKP
jgi:putative transposase